MVLDAEDFWAASLLLDCFFSYLSKLSKLSSTAEYMLIPLNFALRVAWSYSSDTFFKLPKIYWLMDQRPHRKQPISNETMISETVQVYEQKPIRLVVWSLLLLNSPFLLMILRLVCWFSKFMRKLSSVTSMGENIVIHYEP